MIALESTDVKRPPLQKVLTRLAALCKVDGDSEAHAIAVELLTDAAVRCGVFGIMSANEFFGRSEVIES